MRINAHGPRRILSYVARARTSVYILVFQYLRAEKGFVDKFRVKPLGQSLKFTRTHNAGAS